jgi:hypothetical protein
MAARLPEMAGITELAEPVNSHNNLERNCGAEPHRNRAEPAAGPLAEFVLARHRGSILVFDIYYDPSKRKDGQCALTIVP